MTTPRESREGASATLAWLGHPVTVLGLVVLVVNDHVLKAAHPGWVTGKLSDVAGLLLAPPVIAVLLSLVAPRLPARAAVVVGLAAVGAGFTAVKISGYAAQAASAAWSAVAGPSLVRADPSDLLALPALGLAWWCWSWSRERPVGRRPTRLVRLLVLLPSAVLAVAATSAPADIPGREAARVRVVDHGVVFAGEDRGDRGRAVKWWVSRDGGTTWQKPRAEADAQLRAVNLDPGAPVRSACAPEAPRRCYRLVSDRLAVQSSDDAGRTWRTEWEVGDRDRELLARWDRGRDGQRAMLAGRDLAVWAAPAGGHRVMVANGRDGFLVRYPDGRWSRIGWLGGQPARPLGRDPDSTGESMRAVALLLTLGGVVLMVAAARAGRRRGLGLWWPVLLSVPALLAGVLVLPHFTGLPSSSDQADPFGGLIALPVVLMGVLVALITVWSLGVPGRWTGEVLIALLVTLVLVGGALFVWLAGWSDGDRWGVLAALVAAVPGLLLGWYAGRLVRPERRLPDPPWPAPPQPVTPG